MKKILSIVVIIIVIAIIFSIANKEKTPAETGPVKIGGAFILSGPQALVGELQKNAVEIAVEEVNAAGGINGRLVELVLEDSTYEPKTALSAYQALKLKGVKYVIADGSPVVTAIREPVVTDGNIIIAAGATTPAYFDGSNLSCRIALTAKNFGPGFTELIQKKGYKNVSVLLPDNEYGRGLFDEFSKAFSKTDGSLVIAEFYNAAPTAGDYRTNITKLKAKESETDALIVVQVSNTVEAMLKQISDLGWKKPILSDYYMIQNPALKNLSLANGIDFIDYEYSRDVSATESEVAKNFKATYTAKFGSAPVYLGAGHYDAAKILMTSIDEAGDDTAKVAKYISNLENYQGVTGTLTFNDDCEVSRESVFRTVKDGKIVDLE